METLRKYSVLHEYFKERGQESIFDRSLGEEHESIRGWGELQGSSIPVSAFSIKETTFEWITRSQESCRQRSWSGC